MRAILVACAMGAGCGASQQALGEVNSLRSVRLRPGLLAQISNPGNGSASMELERAFAPKKGISPQCEAIREEGAEIAREVRQLEEEYKDIASAGGGTSHNATLRRLRQEINALRERARIVFQRYKACLKSH